MAERREFKDVIFEWDGKEYALRSDKTIMRAIAIAERHLTLHELIRYQHARSTLPFMAIAEAWGAVLRYVGVDVSDAAVYKRLSRGGENQAEAVQQAFVSLLMLMIPDDSASAANGKEPVPTLAVSDTSLSPPPSKQPTPGESDPTSSGGSIQ